MPTDDPTRWREISPYLDEALDLEEPARAQWLRDLEQREPTMAAAVRSLLAEREQLAREPLLNDERTAALSRAGLTGQQLGAYTLESALGHGGMGTVWLARRSDGRYEGHVAVKVLNAALLGRPTEQRFVREGSVLAKLRHPNIAQLVDAGVAPSGQPYLVLEYIEGERIDRYAEQRNLSIDARVRLFLDVLAAVAHAHSHLIVHRDIKPTNILVTSTGVVKLLDFGIAALLGGPEEAQLTREAGAGLTPEYAAPEQLLNQAVTTATDVYALGLVLFVLLAGKHPHGPEGKSVPELARATLDHDAPRPSEVASDPTLGRSLRGDLDNIVAKALKKDPADRYSTAEVLAQDLRCFLSCKPVSAQRDSLTYRAGKFMRRHRGAVAAGLTTALVLIGATIVTTWQMIEARQQRDEALFQSRRAEFQSRFAYQIMSEVGEDGKPITIRELLEKGIEVLEKSYGDDPRFVISTLMNMSGRYMDLGDTEGEYNALVKAERLARQLGDPERMVYVQCNTVETELALGRPAQARERMREGLENLAKLQKPSFDRETDCGMAQARLLWSEGKTPEAIEAATKVARLFEIENKQDEDISYQSITSMLEVMLGREGRSREAIEWNTKQIVALERSGRGTTMSIGMARHNRATNLYAVGEARAALDLQRTVVEPLIAQQGEDGVASPLLGRLGLYQVRVEETDTGMAWLDRAVAVAAARNNQLDQLGAVLNRGRANVLLGRLDAALEDARVVEQLAQSNPADNSDALRGARLVRAQVLVARGQAQEAIREIDGLLVEVGYPSRRAAARLAETLTLKARAEQGLGRTAAALTTAQDALKIAEQTAVQPEHSTNVGAALMMLAELQRATGDVEAARASAKRAGATLSAGLGPEHSETQAALRFQ